ncbi:MAG: putative 2OG-Fe(II) oxygenase [Pseudomonadota bacterium]
MPVQSLQRWLGETRHRLRGGDRTAAQDRLDQALTSWPHDIAAWALQGIVWRLGETPEARARARWLHEQSGLVQMRKLEAPPDLIDRARATMTRLHGAAGMPLSQSLRGGSQTRGTLFHRSDPDLEALHEAILSTLEAYRKELPEADAGHPLLTSRDEPWRLAGSWSVRLSGGGDHHAAHIHPSGLISSALYISVPTSDPSDQPGWLELGRPPSDLGLDLEPLATLEPKEGHLALFPSTLYHGTRPFETPSSEARRMTVAFDVITKAHMT